jgi:iron complex outermembrane recepter protein
MTHRSPLFAIAPLTLMIAALPSAWAEDATVLPQVNVTATATNGESISDSDVARKRVTTSDTASLLLDVPGVAVQNAGGVSSLPVIHGLADDRLRIKTDGVDAVASCPNHMNSPLSYVDPTNVGSVKVYAGITPVSVGGDSIGGTIVVESPMPVFAASGETLVKGEAGAFYRSNGNGSGANVSGTYATDSLNVTYAGATAKSDDYKAGGDFKSFTATGNAGGTLDKDVVGSTAYKSENQSLSVALKGSDKLFEAKYSVQNIPYEWYPNQRMDMLGNDQERLNLRYLGQIAWGTLEAQAYHEKVSHYMDFARDKEFYYSYTPGGYPCGVITATCAHGMPMYTEGKTDGVSVKANIDLAQQGILRIGSEYQHYTLNDWWPPSGAGMYPNTFYNIKDGKRDRLALFSEWDTRWTPEWQSLLGIRGEQVSMDTGTVSGYMDTVSFGYSYPADAARLNNASRAKTDNNWDLTAMGSYTPDAGQSYEFGYARKTRSPNLYERYTWSANGMATIMNNFVGDGNGYIGNLDLKPEVANILSATADWHDAAKEVWGLKATPYYTHVQNYIDARRCPTGTFSGTACSAANAAQTTGFVNLQYVNQSARLYGIDISGHVLLGRSGGFGSFTGIGMLSYVRGTNQTTGDNLYNIMPLNAKLALVQKLNGWANTVELLMVDHKNHVSQVRDEVQTGAYALVNLRSRYEWSKVSVDVGIDNLFDRNYGLPLGGAYVGQGITMARALVPWGIAVPGSGRSFYAGVNVKF